MNETKQDLAVLETVEDKKRADLERAQKQAFENAKGIQEKLAKDFEYLTKHLSKDCIKELVLSGVHLEDVYNSLKRGQEREKTKRWMSKMDIENIEFEDEDGLITIITKNDKYKWYLP